MAESVLMQYSKYYHTNYIKMYLTGNRKQREWITMAAHNQQLMPTTEGGLDFKFNMTNTACFLRRTMGRELFLDT